MGGDLRNGWLKGKPVKKMTPLTRQTREKDDTANKANQVVGRSCRRKA